MGDQPAKVLYRKLSLPPHWLPRSTPPQGHRIATLLPTRPISLIQRLAAMAKISPCFSDAPLCFIPYSHSLQHTSTVNHSNPIFKYALHHSLREPELAVGYDTGHQVCHTYIHSICHCGCKSEKKGMEHPNSIPSNPLNSRINTGNQLAFSVVKAGFHFYLLSFFNYVLAWPPWFLHRLTFDSSVNQTDDCQLTPLTIVTSICCTHDWKSSSA